MYTPLTVMDSIFRSSQVGKRGSGEEDFVSTFCGQNCPFGLIDHSSSSHWVSSLRPKQLERRSAPQNQTPWPEARKELTAHSGLEGALSRGVEVFLRSFSLMNQGGDLMVTYVPGEVAWGERAPVRAPSCYYGVILNRGLVSTAPR